MNWSDIQKLVPAPGAAVDFDACLAAFPDLELAKNTPQGKYHREGNVWIHTMMVVNELLALPDYLNATRAEQEILFLAALRHDSAKHSTTVVDKETGEIHHPGHSVKGEVDTRIVFWDANAPFETRESICSLTRLHQYPFFATTGSRSGKSTEYVLRELSWQTNLRMLATLAEADMRGRICDDQQRVLDNINEFRLKAIEDECYEQPRHFASAHTRVRYFRGANVHPSQDLYKVAGSEVTLMAGHPASGKNTYIEENFPHVQVVSFDDTRKRLRLRHGKNEGKVAHAVIDQATELLRRREPFVWNATNLNALMRKKALDLLYRYNADVRIVYLEQPRNELLRRNAKRDTSLTNKKLEEMLVRWDMPRLTEAPKVDYVVS